MRFKLQFGVDLIMVAVWKPKRLSCRNKIKCKTIEKRSNRAEMEELFEVTLNARIGFRVTSTAMLSYLGLF